MQIIDFGVWHTGFSYAWHSDVVRKYFGHCIVNKIQDGRHLCKVKQWIDIIFDRIEAQS